MNAAEFLVIAQKFKDAMTGFKTRLEEYAPLLKKAESEDPCVVGFDKKLDEIDAFAEANNNWLTNEVGPTQTAYKNALNNLGFFAKRDSAAISMVNEITALVKNVSAFRDNMKVTPEARAALRAKFAACPTLKDPNAEKNTDTKDDTKKEPEAGTNPPTNDQKTQADDDWAPGEVTNTNNPGTPGAPSTTSSQTTTSTPTTVAGQAGKSNKSERKKRKGLLPKRGFNPLSRFSSHTYNLSLYMITPAAYAQFVTVNEKKSLSNLPNGNSGVYLIAQSGGINNNLNQRPSGMNMDYYIDNLKIISYFPGSDPGVEIARTEYTFNIIEPLSYSFITRLGQAAKDMLKDSAQLPAKAGENTHLAMRQHFILGIEFTGYNSDGSIAEQALGNNVVSGNAGESEKSVLPPKLYYDIVITGMSFNLDGNNIVYNVKATQANTNEALGTKRGKVLNRVEIVGSTVDEMFQSLMSFMNNQQTDIVKGKAAQYPIKYNIEYTTDPDIENIKKAKIMNPAKQATGYKADGGLARQPMTDVKKVTDVTDKVSVNAALKNPGAQKLVFEPNTVIGQMIRKIVTESDYLANALDALKKAQPEPKSPNNNEGDENVPNPTVKGISWFSIGSKLSDIRWDELRNDWVYTITYVISTYKTPMTTADIATKYTSYPGPVKQYQYWFTGENTEVLKFSQTIDHLFYVVSSELANFSSAPSDPPKNPGERPPGDKQGTTGKGLDPQNTFINSLFSGKDWVRSKIEILGDPDYLIYDLPAGKNISTYYANDGTVINPLAGQVFIEINFQEAVDYNRNYATESDSSGDYREDGLVRLNPNLVIWNYPKIVTEKLEAQGIYLDGISYLVWKSTSYFKSGKFTQELDLTINQFSSLAIEENKDAPAPVPAPAPGPGPTPPAKPPVARPPPSGTKKPVKPAPAPQPSPPKREIVGTCKAPSGQQGVVANDDSTIQVPAWQNDAAQSSGGTATALGRDIRTFGGRRPGSMGAGQGRAGSATVPTNQDSANVRIFGSNFQNARFVRITPGGGGG